MSGVPTPEMLDRATAAREIGTLIALVLIRCHGDADAALAMLGSFEGIAPPQDPEEIDAVPIAAQAIRDAVGLGVEPA